MTDQATERSIPDGRWQRLFGLGLDAFGLLAALAATPFNGAGAVASICFTVGSTLLFWGLMLRYFSALETKMIALLERQLPPSVGPTTESWPNEPT